MANICEIPETKMSRCGIVSPEEPKQHTPRPPMMAFTPRSATKARKVYLKYSPLYGFLYTSS